MKMMNKKPFRRLFAVMLAAVVIAFSLGGCSAGSSGSKMPMGAATNEILTLSPVSQDKELVTIHYEYGLNIAGALEETIETQFPHVDVVMVHDGGNDSTSLLEGNLR